MKIFHIITAVQLLLSCLDGGGVAIRGYQGRVSFNQHYIIEINRGAPA